AAQAAARADVTDQVRARRVQQDLAEPPQTRRVRRSVAGGGGGELPELAGRDLAAREVDRQRVGGRKGLHAAKDGALAIVAVAVDEKVDDRVVIGHGGEVRKREQRLDLGREQEVARRRGVVERLDSEPVARAEQAAQPAIPDGEREHALNAFETALAPPS